MVSPGRKHPVIKPPSDLKVAVEQAFNFSFNIWKVALLLVCVSVSIVQEQVFVFSFCSFYNTVKLVGSYL